MVILRAFAALLAGFATLTALIVSFKALLSRLVPEWVGAEAQPRPSFTFVNLGFSFLAAAAGGYVTAWSANGNPLALVLVLAIVVLTIGALSALQERGKQPVWYALISLILAPLGVLAGGLVRLRILGIL